MGNMVKILDDNEVDGWEFEDSDEDDDWEEEEEEEEEDWEDIDAGIDFYS